MRSILFAASLCAVSIEAIKTNTFNQTTFDDVFGEKAEDTTTLTDADKSSATTQYVVD